MGAGMAYMGAFSGSLSTRNTFKNAVLNTDTFIPITPNGTGVQAAHEYYNSNGATPGYLAVGIDATKAYIRSNTVGGTVLPLQIFVGAGTTPSMTFATDGSVGLASLALTGSISAVNGTFTGNVSAVNGVFSGAISDYKGNVRDIPQNLQTVSYTLNVSDAGKHIATTAEVIIPSGVLLIGQAVTIYNSSAASITITQGAGVTLKLSGTATTGNRTLAQQGVATALCVGTDTFVVTGSGLT
jgi:hypothetical protein